MNSESKKLEILAGLEPLFQQAEKENKWFYCTYQGLTFSPKELRALQAKDQYIWGACNWMLIEPVSLLRDVEKVKKEAEDHNALILERVEGK